ncbi:ankyrin repeat-containing domain protein [Xylaria telfairii]|nr:ankyrin repeat-containing domain protein [Xylaria telfairii]
MVNKRVSHIIRRNPNWGDYKSALREKLDNNDNTYPQVLLNLGMLERGYVESTKNGIEEYLSKKTPQPNDILNTVVSAIQYLPAKLLLCWVFHAQRPLTVSELAVALTLTPDKLCDKKLDLEMICDELSLAAVRHLIHSMGTLLEIVAGEVRPVHYSICQYFKALPTFFHPSFHAFATTCCLRYMSACSSYADKGSSDGGSGDSDSSDNTQTKVTAFLAYAEAFWPEHYKLDTSSSYPFHAEIHDFLTDQPSHFKKWISNYRFPFDWSEAIDPENVMLLVLRLGFRQLLESLANRGGIIFSSDGIVDILVVAARSGNVANFHRLHNVTAPDLPLARVICAAAEYGHTEIVRLLMKQKNNTPSPSTSHSQETNDPLFLAASNGHAETVAVLLSCGRPISSPNEPAPELGGAPTFRTNPVLVAAQTGDFKTLSVLKRLRPDDFEALARSPDADGKLPLQHCCLSGSPSAFRLLFDVSKPTNYELLKLICSAAEKGSFLIVDWLIDAGAPILSSTPRGPLQAATENGHYSVVYRLKSREGIEPGDGLTYEGKGPFRLENTMSGMLELSLAFKAGFHDFRNGCPAPSQRDDYPNYDSRIIDLLAPFRRRLDDAIAVKSAAF